MVLIKPSKSSSDLANLVQVDELGMKSHSECAIQKDASHFSHHADLPPPRKPLIHCLQDVHHLDVDDLPSVGSPRSLSPTKAQRSEWKADSHQSKGNSLTIQPVSSVGVFHPPSPSSISPGISRSPDPVTSRDVTSSLPPLPPSPVKDRPTMPPSPGRHVRIPSTGSRPTVMELAQTLMDNPPEESHAQLSSPDVLPPPSSRETYVPAELLLRPRPNALSQIQAEKRKSSYERYSAIIMPPLKEETTPTPSPAGTLARTAVREAELGPNEHPAPAAFQTIASNASEGPLLATVKKYTRLAEREEKKLYEVAKRYGTTAKIVHQLAEPPELIEILGGTLAIRQGTRAHWTPENTTMHLVRSLNGLILIDELDLNVKNLCSAFSFCVTILDSVYVWHGRGSSAQERKSAFQYANALLDNKGTPIELVEGENDADEMFWMIMGDTEFAAADYWRWRKMSPHIDPFVWRVDIKNIGQPVTFFPDLQQSVYIVHCIWELFIVVGKNVRSDRVTIRFALEVAMKMSTVEASCKPYDPTVHVLILPSQLPLDLQQGVRDLDEAWLNEGEIPDHMNLLPASEALTQLGTRLWPKAAVQDHDMLPLDYFLIIYHDVVWHNVIEFFLAIANYPPFQEASREQLRRRFRYGPFALNLFEFYVLVLSPFHTVTHGTPIRDTVDIRSDKQLSCFPALVSSCLLEHHSPSTHRNGGAIQALTNLKNNAGQSQEQLRREFKDVRYHFNSRYVRLYGACNRDGFYDDIVDAAWDNGLGVHALVWFGFNGDDVWLGRRDVLFASLHKNPRAKFVTSVVQFGSEPLFDNVSPHHELARQVELAKANLSSLGIPVTVSELAYGYQERGGAQDVLDEIDSINIHLLPFFSQNASTGMASLLFLSSAELTWMATFS
ncbi:hypothetical protein NLJ89_g2435 [Agrocybe chaxingu]|uniref:Gelsolin-like domain-containing protein n=1 Tax=Agrocybe chaxingu TaxID=84603 RepID=A0A9W8MWG7_9AGAR|nr:hypothetical protein NLJ89_g2435 [Agrocybe chaxingu]